MDEMLNTDEVQFIDSMLILYNKGVSSVCIESSQNSKVLFPNGFNTDKYNQLVPALVKKGLLVSKFDSPRDGPILSLTEKAIRKCNVS